MTAEQINAIMPPDAVPGGLELGHTMGPLGKEDIWYTLSGSYIPSRAAELLCIAELVLKLCAQEWELRVSRVDGVRHCVEMVDSEVVEGVLQDVVKVCEVADTLLEALAKAYSAV